MKTLRAKLLIRALAMTAFFIVGFNRVIGNYLFPIELQRQVDLGAAPVLRLCAKQGVTQEVFRQCALRASADSLFENLVFNFELCPGKLAGSIEPQSNCRQVKLTGVAWQSLEPTGVPELEFSEAKVNDEVFLLYKQASAVDGPVLLINKQELHDFTSRVIAARDQVVIRSLPMASLCVLLLILYLLKEITRPIRKIEEYVSRLTPENLMLSDGPIVSPYRELDNVSNAIEALRQRMAIGLQDLQRFASNASHELLTPITVMRGRIEHMIGSAETGSTVQVRLRQIDDELRKLTTLTRKLLLLARIDSRVMALEHQVIRLDVLLNDFLEDAMTFQEGIHISSRIQENLLIGGDQDLIAQLVQNLFTNAVNYNKPGGWIEIELSSRGDCAVLVVRNSVAEFSANTLSNAFDRFYRGENAKSAGVVGSGLGLSLCKAIVAMHKGDIKMSQAESTCVSLEVQLPLNCQGKS